MIAATLAFVRHYDLRCLGARRWSTVATLLGVALVVAAFCSLLSLADSLRRALLVTADPHNVIVLAEGATAESNSALSNADAARLTTIPHVGQSAQGRPLVSPEIVVQTTVARHGAAGATASVGVRGVDQNVAFAVHSDIKLTAGRWFQPGSDELVVGQTAARQFEPCQIGQKLECVGRTFEIVGVFSAGGGAHESEYWGHVSNVGAAYRRDRYSSAVIRLDTAEPSVVDEAARRITLADVALRGVSEPAYYGAETANARIVQGLALLTVAIMGIGAIFASMNAMHSALIGRTREIGMLRAIGFSARRIATGLIFESLVIAFCGGVLGCLVSAMLSWIGGTSDLVGTATFTSVAFELRPSLRAVTASLGVAAAIGLLGGIWPARRAARLPVVRALHVS